MITEKRKAKEVRFTNNENRSCCKYSDIKCIKGRAYRYIPSSI